MKKSLFALAAAALLFSACSDAVVSNSENEAKDVGSITIYAKDNLTREAIEGVEVQILTESKVRKTDEFGALKIKDKAIGSYKLRISHKDYATLIRQVKIADGSKEELARVEDVVEEVSMYKLGTTIDGFIYYPDEGAVKSGKPGKPAAGVTVTFSWTNTEIYPGLVSTTTDSTGHYVFENMPELAAGSVYVPQTKIGDYVYFGQKAAGALRVDEVNTVGTLVLALDQNPLVMISENTSSLDSTTSIKLTFSEPLNADSVKAHHWRIQNSDPNDVLVKVSLSADKKTVTIAPASGAWEVGEVYTFKAAKAWGEDGSTNEALQDSTFSVKQFARTPKAVKDFASADDNGALTLTLSWTANSPEPDYYEIYRMLGEEKTYTLWVSDAPANFGDDMEYVYDYSVDMDTVVTPVKFIIRACNSGNEYVCSDYSKALSFDIPAI